MKLLEYILIALTDPQMDRVLHMVESSLSALREVLQTTLAVLTPLAIAWVGYQVKILMARQAENNKDRKEGQTEIKEGLKENTVLTKEVVSKFSPTGEFRSLLSGAAKGSSEDPVYHKVKLPGPTYEVFPLTESGGQCEWKSEPCHRGRKVRFKCVGPCRMGLHFHHQSAEFLFMVDGDLILESGDQVIHLRKGDSHQTPADMVHSAVVNESGEILCTWIDLESDELEIGIWPGPPSGEVTITNVTTVTTAS